VASFVFSARVTQNALMSPKSTNHLILVLALALSCFQCGNGDQPPKAPATNGPPAKYGYQIVNIWPHDSNAFTQGLILMDGKLLESTGEQGRSSLRRVELETGKVLCGRHRYAERESLPTYLAAPYRVYL
jgi:glutamine cyclotransferase